MSPFTGVGTVLVQVKVERLTMDQATRTPVVVLREDAGERALPIWIGAGEASAIHLKLAEVSVGRPLTHDLLASTIAGLGAVLERVVITRVEQSTYFGRLDLRVEERAVTLDARPSDCIAVALRTGAPIFASDDLLNLVRIEVQEGEDEPPRQPSSSEGMSAAELQEYLRKLDPEDFGRFLP
ncbi:MAG: bifunctional nuclease family protein [Longimicrobiales bacterium]|nr:bifunctional nuclease family protein [Longimicrobiales bacterium]